MSELENIELPQYTFVENHESIFFDEPLWMIKERVRRSLPALTELILDESIPVISYHQSYGAAPLFLTSRGRSANWVRSGRLIWTEDLGEFEYRPAFDNLREVWLHDSNVEMRNMALRSLGMVKDPRFLKDIKKRVLDPNSSINDWGQYISAITHMDSDDVVEILDCMRDFAIMANEGHLMGHEDLKKRDKFYGGPLQFVLADIMEGYAMVCSNPKAVVSATNFVRRTNSFTARRRYGLVLDELKVRSRSTSTLYIPKRFRKKEKLLGAVVEGIEF
ncbi:HEAT repeat domain-containing protein [Candidatus Pacearchaeota archaeon]|nr:HEAT repeat domain-containing protein [Candidatus Pacearchaeota archaeon]